MRAQMLLAVPDVGVNPDDVSPGLLGFLVIFAAALACIPLFRSMTSKLRGVSRTAGLRGPTDTGGPASGDLPGPGPEEGDLAGPVPDEGDVTATARDQDDVSGSGGLDDGSVPDGRPLDGGPLAGGPLAGSVPDEGDRGEPGR